MHTAELQELQAAKEFANRFRAVNAVGVETDAGLAHWQRKIEAAASCQHAAQLARRLLGALRIERITVTPQADVLGHVQAGERFH
jgi:hypothetical protein